MSSWEQSGCTWVSSRYLGLYSRLAQKKDEKKECKWGSRDGGKRTTAITSEGRGVLPLNLPSSGPIGTIAQNGGEH